MRFTRLLLISLLLFLGAALYGQTLYVEMQVRGPENQSPQESGFIRATADGLLETLWDAGFIVYDSGDPAAVSGEVYLPNLLETARSGGAQLLLVVELTADRPETNSPLTPRSFRYSLIDVEEGVPMDSGRASVSELMAKIEVEKESFWADLGGIVGREVLNVQ